MRVVRWSLALWVLLLSGSALAQSYKAPKINFDQKLDGKTLVELRIIRNTVFALHGFDFKSEDMRHYFWNQPWYQKIRKTMERKKKTFRQKSLTARERSFIAKLKAQEEALIQESKQTRRPGQLYNYPLLQNAMQFPKPGQKSRRMIEDHGFVVRPAMHEQYFNVYEDNDYRMIPSFITSDSVLQLYHVFFDFSLRDLEKKKLLPAASSLISQLLDRARTTWNRSKVPEVKDAAGLLMVYFGVADSLLSGKTARLPGKAGQTLKAELALVKDHSGQAKSPLMGSLLDYSTFIPRGHYTRSKDLKRYFLGMSWLGQVFFTLKQDRHLRAALLLAYYLEFYETKNKNFGSGPLKLLWEVIYEPTVFYVGAADDLTPHHVRKVTAEIFGDELFKVKSFADPARLKAVREKLSKLNPQRIKTQFQKVPNLGVRFMGQRYVPDTEILQRLSKFPERSFPKGLDLFAVFGNQEARALLDDHYQEPAKWKDYLPTRKKLTAEFAALDSSTWHQNLYWSWLDVLRVLTGPVEKNAPPFAHTSAWRHKQLHTALGSWAELRHDTILYAKPFGAECGGDDEPPKTRGYVEPVPKFYKRLRALLKQNRDGLEKRKLLTKTFNEITNRMDDLLKFLQTVSEKQLSGEKISVPEYEEIRLYGGLLAALTTQLLTDFQSADWNEVKGPDRSVAVIADIGTVGGQVLEEGVGTVDEIFVVVEIDGKPTLTRGAVFSYYEFTWPASDRLTDEKWQSLLKNKKAPKRPDWVDKFLHPEQCPRMPDVFFYSSGC